MIGRSASAVLAVSCVVLVGCGSSSSSPSSTSTAGGDRLSVVTTTTQVTDFARNVGGELIDVHPLLQPNVDPHDFEPAVADLVAIGDADVIVENGVGLESWMRSTIDAAGPHGTIVDASSGVDVVDGDPHIWQDPRNAEVMATNIADAF